MFPRVIVGLGNPGKSYEGTRHNLGFFLVDKIVESLSLTWEEDKKLCAFVATGYLGNKKLSFIKPQNFMNLSGISVLKYKKMYRIENSEFLIVYDDFNMDLGHSKLKFGGSHGGHNGISNIILNIGADFPRFRLGIHPKCKVTSQLSEFVLGEFDYYENQIIQLLIPEWIQELKLIIENGVEKAMNQINKKKKDNIENKIKHEQSDE